MSLAFFALAFFAFALMTVALPAQLREPEERPEDEEAQKKKKDHSKEDEKKEGRTVKLLLTGYGSFRGYEAENPSTLVARHLSGLVLTCPRGSANRTRVEIHFQGRIPVTYSAVDALVPLRHAEGAFDAYVHVGVASGRLSGVELEQRARRAKYEGKDADGQVLKGQMIEEWASDQKEELWTTVNVGSCVEWMKSEGVQHIAPSTDAGLYLCEYIFARSLSSSLGSAKKAPVLFVHVPDLRPEEIPAGTKGQSVYTELEVADVLKKVCWFVGNGGK